MVREREGWMNGERVSLREGERGRDSFKLSR